MTQRTGKVVIGDGFDKTLKLHFFQTGGHMGCLCLYEDSVLVKEVPQLVMKMKVLQRLISG